MRIFRFWPLLVVLCLIDTHSAISWQTVQIKDATKSETIVLRKWGHQRAIYAMEVNISGRIKGRARVQLILHSDPYKEEQLSGKVHVIWGGDWYSDEAEIRYQPEDVDSGELKIRYRFIDLM
jgi:hypothetical protein